MTKPSRVNTNLVIFEVGIKRKTTVSHICFMQTYKVYSYFAKTILCQLTSWKLTKLNAFRLSFLRQCIVHHDINELPTHVKMIYAQQYSRPWCEGLSIMYKNRVWHGLLEEYKIWIEESSGENPFVLGQDWEIIFRSSLIFPIPHNICAKRLFLFSRVEDARDALDIRPLCTCPSYGDVNSF